MQNQAQLEKLEAWLTSNPDDLSAIRRLVTLLNASGTANPPSGSFGKAQARIGQSLSPDWHSTLLNSAHSAETYAHWLSILKSERIRRAVPIGQVFSGRVLTIKGQHTNCDARLKFFKETSVIPGLCFDCYKVQILPENLVAMFQTYFLLLNLDLPNDNARKCMIELRDGIRYPYKAYIYCETIADVRSCLAAFQTLQAQYGITCIQSKISHGCSEYGSVYPKFKFSEHENRTYFTPPTEWQEVEEKYFARLKLNQPQTQSYSKPLISLRDVFGFRTWIKYAELIGDKTCRIFHPAKGPELPAPFVARVKAQAALRRRELTELAAQP